MKKSLLLCCTLTWLTSCAGSAFTGTISPIEGELFFTMLLSWRNDNPVALNDLRLIKISHYTYDGTIQQSSLIVHKIIAQEVIDIFHDIFIAEFPLDTISAFSSRSITGRPGVWSKHAYGLAIDINYLVNPYHKGNVLIPENAAPYLDRSLNAKGMIHHGDACYQAFIQRGWTWGGDWQIPRGYVDYMHFEKDPAVVLP